MLASSPRKQRQVFGSRHVSWIMFLCLMTTLPASANLIPEGGELRVNTTTSNQQEHPSAAIDADGDFVVTWESSDQDGGGYGVYAQRYAADGRRRGGEFRVNTATQNDQWDPTIAMDADGDFVIAWTGGDGSNSGIFAQRYAADGSRRGGDFLANTTITNNQLEPVVAMDADGDFVIVWSSGDGSSSGIYGQRFAADGSRRGGEFRVNTTTGDRQSEPSVAMDVDGDFVVAWDSRVDGVYAQRYAANGGPLAGEFRVSTKNIFPYFDFITVAMDGDGDFVVTWLYDLSDIYAQRYTADGTPHSGNFKVETTYKAAFPSLAINANGDYIIVWVAVESVSYIGVYARRYAADGSPQGSEFRVNTKETASDVTPSIAMNGAGRFVIAWTRNDPDIDRNIYARRYTQTPDRWVMHLPLVHR